MVRKKNYAQPRILADADILLERSFLASVVDQMVVESVGQEVVTQDFSAHDDFNFNWETSN